MSPEAPVPPDAVGKKKVLFLYTWVFHDGNLALSGTTETCFTTMQRVLRRDHKYLIG